jgi:hypothetical protein
MKKFVNVDGQYARTVIPYPHNPHSNIESARHYDKMCMADRFAQVGDSLTPLERNMFEGFLSITCGGTWEETSFFEYLRWWALANYNYTDFMAIGLTYKLRCGQSAFARRFFDEATATGRLSYAFSSPVRAVIDKGSVVEVVLREDSDTHMQVFKARRVICTIPLNVLHTVAFSPALPALKQEASVLGHANHVVKVHAEVADHNLRSLGAFAYPTGKLTYAFGDGTTPAGNTHLVAFGSSLPGVHLQPEDDMTETLAAWRNFSPEMDIQRVVFHNWHRDEFARGAWEWLRPGMATKYLEGLRARHGNVLFGSADWAMGWRAFIDGGIEDGGRVAKIAGEEIEALRQAEEDREGVVVVR